jgi:C1A family cysteine protease
MKKIMALFIGALFFLTSISAFSVIGIKVYSNCETKIIASDEYQFKFGCIVEEFDNAEYILGSPPANSWDWRDHGIMTSVKNQGKCGSCVAFAMVGALEAVYKWKKDEYLNLAEAHLFFCGGGECDDGWSISEAVIQVEIDGVCDESCFPYTDHDQGCNPCNDWEDRVKKAKWEYVDGTGIFGRSSMKNALVTYGPLATYFVVYDDFLNFWYSPGDTVYRRTSNTDIAGHAVVLVGYDDAQQCWICKNSWGYSDGNGDGYFKIGYGQAGIANYGAYIKEVGNKKKSINAPSFYHSMENIFAQFPILQKILLKL